MEWPERPRHWGDLAQGGATAAPGGPVTPTSSGSRGLRGSVRPPGAGLPAQSGPRAWRGSCGAERGPSRAASSTRSCSSATDPRRGYQGPVCRQAVAPSWGAAAHPGPDVPSSSAALLVSANRPSSRPAPPIPGLSAPEPPEDPGFAHRLRSPRLRSRIPREVSVRCPRLGAGGSGPGAAEHPRRPTPTPPRTVGSPVGDLASFSSRLTYVFHCTVIS